MVPLPAWPPQGSSAGPSPGLPHGGSSSARGAADDGETASTLRRWPSERAVPRPTPTRAAPTASVRFGSAPPELDLHLQDLDAPTKLGVPVLGAVDARLGTGQVSLEPLEALPQLAFSAASRLQVATKPLRFREVCCSPLPVGPLPLGLVRPLPWPPHRSTRRHRRRQGRRRIALAVRRALAAFGRTSVRCTHHATRHSIRTRRKTGAHPPVIFCGWTRLCPGSEGVGSGAGEATPRPVRERRRGAGYRRGRGSAAG